MRVRGVIPSYLCMRGGQPLAYVDPKQGVLPQGYVELEEEGLAQVQQGPPEHPRGNILTHSPPHLQLPRHNAAVPVHPWSWGMREGLVREGVREVRGRRVKRKKAGN